MGKRARKIVPSYLLALVIFALIFHARFDGPAQEFVDFLAHAAFVHVFFPATFGSFSGPLWTLGIEVQFYVLFAFAAPLVVRRPLVAYLASVAVALTYRASIAALGFDSDFGWINQLPAVLDVFGAGVAAAFLFTAASGSSRNPHPLLASAAALGAAAIAVGGLCAAVTVAASGGDEGVHRWLNAWRGAFGPVLAVVTLGIALGSARLRAIASSRPLYGLSLVSYSAYLCNLEIAVALARLGLPPPAVFWLGAGGTLALSAALTYGFERPLQRADLGVVLRELRRFAAFPRLGGRYGSALTDRSGPA